MAVSSGWVGSSAKAETGKAWMSEARTVLRLSPNGWMSEMIGKSKEIRFINNTNRTQASIYDLMGRPTAVTDYYFENNATITAATQSGWALRTGVFPSGSTLTIINRGYIRGGGGNGAGSNNGGNGGDAIHLDYPTRINNAGYIFGGGGGGGSSGLNLSGIGFTPVSGGGGGAGVPAGIGGGSIDSNGKPTIAASGNTTNGGAGHTIRFVNIMHYGGKGGDVGIGGGGASVSPTPPYHGYRDHGYRAAGAAGSSVRRNGHALSWIAGNTADRVKGPIR